MFNFIKQKTQPNKAGNARKNFKASVLNTGISSWFELGLDANFRPSDAALLSTYQNSIYVFRAVKLISQTASSYPLKVFSILNIRGDSDEVLNSPALDILKTDQHTNSVNSLMQILYAHILLTGKAYLYRVDDNTLRVIAPNNVQENISRRDNSIMSYRVQLGDARSVTVPVEDIIAFRDIDPLDLNQGESANVASRLRVLLEQKIVQYQNSLLDNGAVPSKIISPKESAGTASRDRINESQREFDQVFKGVQNQGKTLVSPTPLEVHELASPMKDLKLQESLDFTAKEIEIAFGLPHGILQSENVNVADGKNSKNSLIENTIKPLVMDVVETLNNNLIEQFGNRLFYKVELPSVDDEKQQSEILTAYVAQGIMTADEARVKIGYDPKGGDADLLQVKQQEDRQQARKVIANRKKLFVELEVQEKNYKKLLAQKDKQT